ncbi:MAG: hypothetical protein FD146_1891 [Anaerolineaceae bacterium]|nr:MAG: hypothetical protein FD146_1891 [Anaerolineaceae bacterium]
MQRRTLLSLALLFALILGACRPTTPDVNPLATPETGRAATFVTVANTVEARPDETDDFSPVEPGDRLQVRGQARTGDDSRSRLDLQPDGTIVRLGPNTLFTLEEMNAETDAPFTRLNLLFGQIWIVLSGGELQVDTEFGNASVRGSYMSAAFDEQTGLAVTCLEGHCALANEHGSIELTGGEASGIPGPGQPPSPARPMTGDENQQWLDAVPEAAPLLPPALTPTPPGPDLPAAAEGTLNTRHLQYALTNNCTLPEDVAAVGDWVWLFQRLPDANGGALTERVVVPAGQTATGQLPPGQYAVTDWFADGEQHGPQIINSDGGVLQVDACPNADGGQPPAGGPGTGQPLSDATTYTLTNACDRTWHWLFTGPQTIAVDIAPGETATGSLPPGTYTATDWLDGNTDSHTSALAPGGALTVTSCVAP